MPEIGNQIKKIRKKLGLTQKELSTKLGITQSTLSDIEINRFKPSFEIISKLAKEYNVSLYFLLLGDEEMFLPPEALSLIKIKKYAVNEEHVREFLYNFQKSHILQYSIIGHYKRRMASYKNEILEEIDGFKKQEEK